MPKDAMSWMSSWECIRTSMIMANQGDLPEVVPEWKQLIYIKGGPSQQEVVSVPVMDPLMRWRRPVDEGRVFDLFLRG
jgi:hypothetical protein